jgi:Uma2 family endonuclease
MVVARKPRATYADLLALPDNVVGELIGGTLYASPRPAPRHFLASSALGEELGPPFKRGRGGPGGWMIADEPELRLGDDTLVPDLGGWRRERMPQTPIDRAYITLAPDWVAEVLSPSTAALDRREKLRVYAREHVPHVWFIDPTPQTLEVLVLDGESYRVSQVESGDAKVRAQPFDAIELDLSILWQL